MMVRNLRDACLVLGAALASGCYNYVPVSEPAPRTEVRIAVPVRSAAQRPNRPPETFAVEGVVVASGDTLVLATQTRQETGAFRETVRQDTLRIAAAELLTVEQRVFSRGKTIGLSAVVAAATALLAVGIYNAAVGSTDNGPGNGGPVAQRWDVPLFDPLLRLLGR